MLADEANVEYGSRHATAYAFPAEIVTEAMPKRKPSQAL